MRSIAVYGDSLSTGSHGSGGYEGLIKEGLKLDKVYNFSVGSSGLTKATPNHMLGILNSIPVPEDAGIIMVWHGSNDWYWGSGMQEFEDGIEEAVKRIRLGNPKAFLIWLTPIFRYEKPHECPEKGEAYELPNRLGFTLSDYCTQLERSSQKLGFYLLDMHRLSNIHKENMDYYLEDQVHPNELGYQKIAKPMIQELERFL